MLSKNLFPWTIIIFGKGYHFDIDGHFPVFCIFKPRVTVVKLYTVFHNKKTFTDNLYSKAAYEPQWHIFTNVWTFPKIPYWNLCAYEYKGLPISFCLGSLHKQVCTRRESVRTWQTWLCTFTLYVLVCVYGSSQKWPSQVRENAVQFCTFP